MAATQTLSLTRELYVPRELVFDVWTQPEHLAQWFSPGPDFERTARVDLCVGGSYQLTWRGTDEVGYQQSGVYEALAVPQQLDFSVRIEAGDEVLATTQVQLRLTDLGGGTRIELVEHGLVNANQCTVSERRWLLCLDQLEAYFSVI
jgi:uncharacterized protein YndB with AHSA1/START domain